LTATGSSPIMPGTMNTPDAKERKAKYKASLNLPNTPFPMRANLAENEKLSRRRWDEENLHARLIEKRQGAPAFVFHDGPPFANGSIHVGHVLNKVLKDLVVRTRNMNGELCHYVPGWDCHGLPIEHKVMTELLSSGRMKELEQLDPVARWREIRKACYAYATRFRELQADQMQRLLTLADYDNPYLTMAAPYEQSVLEVFAALVEQGIVYRDLKPVHWSIANQTALADAELEYKDRKDPSVYVGFAATDPQAVFAAFGVAGAQPGHDQVTFTIWTTTPWTLPANMLIAVHAEHEYSLLRLGGRLMVVATELAAKVASLEGHEVEQLSRVRGAALVGLEYRHPFVDREGRIVAGEHVTLEDGTGLVHTAPGHGIEDFGLGQREDLPVYSPVKADGRFDDSVPEWLRGDLVWEANSKIVEHLRESGHLYHFHEFVHSYPHDWRSKTPVIFRCTEQWFIAVDKPTVRDDKSLRMLALEAAEQKIAFVPAWGRNRLRGMLESRPDWCISRQRSWGLPIPAFRRPDGQVLLTAASVRAIAEVFGRLGSDAWFSLSPAELLESYDPASDADLGGAAIDKSRLEKMFDIFDVWLESGSSWNAVMRKRGIGFPTDLYLEGSDQHRGWFQLSLLPALGATGQPPFKTLLTHGFMVDKEGKKMSKSGSNALDVEDLLKLYGADVLRWWVSSLAFENDIKVDRSFFDAAGEAYRKVRNTLRFLLSNLYDFNESETVGHYPPTSLDAWALGRAAELREKVREAYFSYQYRTANLLLFDFCNEDLSAIYLDAVKDRLYCDKPDSPRRRATQSALRQIAELLITLLAPILPHTADEAHRALHGEGAESVHLGTYADILAPQLDRHWDAVLNLRAAARKALEEAKSAGIENPLDAGLVLPDPEGVIAAYRAELPEIFGVSRVHLVSEGNIQVRDLRAEPRCERSWKRDETVRLRSDGGYLTDRDAEAVGIG
jgi:isoleucyl-tRNA synthetase